MTIWQKFLKREPSSAVMDVVHEPFKRDESGAAGNNSVILNKLNGFALCPCFQFQ